jgi:Ca2+-binding RTX toxin-like protein
MSTGPSTSTQPYLLGSEPNVRFTSILAAGDALPGGGVFAGVPDGIEVLDNGNGTLTVLVAHQLEATAGIIRDHGSKGSFVDKLVIDQSTLAVISSDDLIQSVKLWDDANDTYVSGTTAFRSFSCTDLPALTAFFNPATGLGTQVRFLFTVEESGTEGRAFATDINTGVAYELPYLGNTHWEKAEANPLAQDKTVIAITDDTFGGQLYLYVGQKQSTGTDIQKAGLANGSLFGIKVAGVTDEANSTPVTGSFTLAAIGASGDVSNMTGTQIESESDAAGVTGFLRPEDCEWDPANPNVLYLVTTNSATGNTRLYKLTFTDVSNPQLGGTIECLLTGSEGIKSLDNMDVTDGKIVLQEDPGNLSALARVWEYDIATDSLVQLANFDPARFTKGQPGYITQYEESSGVLDVTSLLGDNDTRAYLMDAQVHKTTSSAATVQLGQLMVMYIDDPFLIGGAGNDNLFGSAANEVLNGFDGNDIARAGSGTDQLYGGNGDDQLFGGNGDDQLYGDADNDQLFGEGGNDQLFGADGTDSLDGGDGKDQLSAGNGNDQLFGQASDDTLNGDAGDDKLFGGTGNDIMNGGAGNDRLEGGANNDTMNGGTENDFLDGGSGKDKMTGGSGADYFVFDNRVATGVDKITDFKSDDRLLATVQLSDPDGDGRIDFGSVLTFSTGNTVDINDGSKNITSLTSDGTVVIDGVTYFSYKLTPTATAAALTMQSAFATTNVPSVGVDALRTSVHGGEDIPSLHSPMAHHFVGVSIDHLI